MNLLHSNLDGLGKHVSITVLEGHLTSRFVEQTFWSKEIPFMVSYNDMTYLVVIGSDLTVNWENVVGENLTKVPSVEQIAKFLNSIQYLLRDCWAFLEWDESKMDIQLVGYSR